MTKTLERFFQTSLLSTVSLLIIVSSLKFYSVEDIDDLQSLLIPIAFFGVYFCVNWFLGNRVLNKLQPEVNRVEDMNFEAEFDQVDPFEMFDYFKKPSYLQLENKKEEDPTDLLIKEEKRKELEDEYR